ncbi:DUF2759 domain-containing protein [Heyndrickxia coagulans]|uniref:DUF2759 domain-containing protein n=1 Tax=Heyndrickxia coagulans TaxID=1398 RepID=UPI00034BDFBA|nr:DUF2759 domain-containing protein [Heyndrickxia coagulans]MBF8419229.1 DUF2759 domain-containing protein [Heyndrickxia coagulans]MED4312325.1 DUF2759 domain-containing protein [Heyndrickxia coagulans]MED4344768.1 DUF2759 domain-containing protein [Heyndrickxia coagulans]QWU05672.1 DUF2759 domain-containing protein [Heyndrickxia coagulans]UJZ86343.1 DUF2759 domain-containing protein [Heyndrickxia coagulans]
MGTVIIFSLVSILSLIGFITAAKNKNILGFIFGIISFALFGWFAIMTVIHSGYPSFT